MIASRTTARPRAAHPRRRPLRRTRRAGFTLVEMLMVLSMVAIIARMAIPRVNYDRYRADTAARVTRTVLQQAQRTAILRQIDVIVSFNVAGRGMVVVEDANNNDRADAGERTWFRPLEDGGRFATPAGGVSGTVASAVTGDNLITIDGLPSVIFRRDGAASSTLEAYITAGRGRTEEFRAVLLTRATGRTEAWRRGTAAWRKEGV